MGCKFICVFVPAAFAGTYHEQECPGMHSGDYRLFNDAVSI